MVYVFFGINKGIFYLIFKKLWKFYFFVLSKFIYIHLLVSNSNLCKFPKRTEVLLPPTIYKSFLITRL